MDGVHDLERTVGILVLEAFEDKLHIGCQRFSQGRSSPVEGEYRLLHRCNPTG